MVELDRFGIAARLRDVKSGVVQTRPGLSGVTPKFERLLEFAKRYPWFVGIVVIPTLIAVLYFGFIASDIYVSEARYVVRSVDGPRASVVGNMLQNVGLASSQNDAYSVHDFVLSRDIARRLEHSHDLRGILSRPGLVATAEIKTGKRSIASYIMNPILRTADEGLREP